MDQAFELNDGVWPTMVTPFTPDNRLDNAGIEALVDRFVARGVDGLFAVCQSSEMFFLSLDERVTLAKMVVDAVGGRVGVIASGHVSEQFADQVREITAISETGIDAFVLVTNRIASRESDDATCVKYMERLLAEVPPHVALGLYECPYPFKRLMSTAVLEWCAGTGRFFFLKDTSCDPVRINERAQRLGSTRLKLYNAHTGTLLDSLRLGYAGFSGVMGNFHPELYRALCVAARVGDPKADRIQDYLAMASVFEYQHYPVNAKYYLQQAGLPIHLHTRARDASLLDPSEYPTIEALFRTDAWMHASLAVAARS